MPPLATWFAPREAIRIWAADSALSGDWRWKALLTRANGQPALGFYAWEPGEGAYLPFALNVLTLGADGLVTAVTAFINRVIPEEDDREVIRRMPEQPRADAALNLVEFERFGLPERLD
jgi:RNA polymerase sigma-70 factor (ECF subfamily)